MKLRRGLAEAEAGRWGALIREDLPGGSDQVTPARMPGGVNGEMEMETHPSTAVFRKEWEA